MRQPYVNGVRRPTRSDRYGNHKRIIDTKTRARTTDQRKV